ncbi:DNA polymerase III subunit delta [uncultured Sphingomonas sp.]|uniref:DNA polymerase III subunit delta n=1 Tax=uncultured Sphingomonas sp. TaxID=158754 RepID=UPI002627DF66|nr:DNA polymerase III subunit delta [uncultured Sphingomonas sp.]
MAKSAAIERALDRPDPAIRCYLLYGPDESGSRALAKRLEAAMGADADRIDLEPARLTADPALLADEAAAGSLFGGPRHIRVEGVTDSCLAAVEALLEAPAAGNPVVLIAGALKKDAKLVKRLDGDRAAMSFQSWPPTDADFDRLAIELGRAQGLRIDDDVARRLAHAAEGDRAVLGSEIVKLALYADAAPDRPVEVTHALFDAISAGHGEADTTRFVDAVLGGDPAKLEGELARLAGEGQEGITLVRALLRRLLPMAAARAELERGASPSMAAERHGRAMSLKDRKGVERDVGRWPAARLARAIERLGALDRELRHTAGPGTIAADVEFFAIARAAGRRR